MFIVLRGRTLLCLIHRSWRNRNTPKRDYLCRSASHNRPRGICLLKRDISPSIIPGLQNSTCFLRSTLKPGNPGRLIVSACNRPISNISAYLDSVMAPLVKQLPTSVKDSSHALQILEPLSFTGSHRHLFTIDIQSFYIVTPNNDGLRAFKYTSTCIQNSNHQLTHLFDWLNLSLT